MTKLTQLTDLGFLTREVPVGKGQSVTVRGIAFDDVSLLFRVYGPQLAALTDQVKLDSGAAIADLLFNGGPELIADVIVFVTDTPISERVAAFDVAKKLPMPVQLNIVETALNLTFEEYGGPKNFVEALIRMFGGISGLLGNLQQSKAGSSDFVDSSLSSLDTGSETPDAGPSEPPTSKPE